MYQVTLPDHATPAQMRIASGFFEQLAAAQDAENAQFVQRLRERRNVSERTEGVTLEQRSEATVELARQGIEALDAVNEAIDRAQQSDTPPAPSAVFGGAAAPAPLPEPSATAAPVPAPSSTIPEPSSAPAAAVPGPVITDAAAAVGLPSPTPAASGPVLDKEGLPWDHRIHAESKATNQDGTWRKKRGVTDEEFARVKAEMKAMLSGTSAQAAQVTGSTATTSIPVPAPTATAPVAPSGDNGFGALMLWVQGPMISQPAKITMSDLNATIAECAPIFGIPVPDKGFDISSIKMAPAPLVAMVRAQLGTLAASRGWVEES